MSARKLLAGLRVGATVQCFLLKGDDCVVSLSDPQGFVSYEKVQVSRALMAARICKWGVLILVSRNTVLVYCTLTQF